MGSQKQPIESDVKAIMMQKFGIFAMNKLVDHIWYQNARNDVLILVL